MNVGKRNGIKLFKINIKHLTLAFVAIASAIMMFVGDASIVLSAVALEQDAMCGIEQHVHTDECYDGDILICDVEEHVHDENCYIVLLDDNDINDLLVEIDQNTDKSLNSVIDDTVSKAIENGEQAENQDGVNVELNPEVNTQENEETTDAELAADAELQTETQTQENENNSDDKPLVDESGNLIINKDNISELNNSIKSDDTIPNIVLNENINTTENGGGAGALDTDEGDGAAENEAEGLLPKDEANVGEAVMAVGDNANTGNYKANVYIYLDERWQCIGTTDFTTSRTSNWSNTYVATMNTSNLINLVNTQLGTDFTASSFDVFYGNGIGTASTKASMNESTVTFDSGNNNTVRRAKYLKLSPKNSQVVNTSFDFYTVTLVYPNGTSEDKYVRAGADYILPGEYQWTNDMGTFEGGTAVTVKNKVTYTAQESSEPKVVYNVNFPSISDLYKVTPATVMGSSSYTEQIEEGSNIVILTVSNTEVEGDLNNGTGQTRVIHFAGWRVGTSDTIIKPGTAMSWDDFNSYKTGSTLTLNGMWEYDARQSCCFYIRYDSVAVDTSGNVTGQESNKYTNQLYATYVGNATNHDWSTNNELYHIADSTADNSLTADKRIRELVGQRDDGVYLLSFPDDEEIFEKLKGYAEHLSVDGVPVDVNDLHEDGYAIRWYVFKSQSDAWHIDGKLVRKNGYLTVTKRFAGNKAAVNMAKQSFYIEAAGANNGITNLTLNNYTAYDAATDTYEWLMDDVTYNESWVLTEKNSQVAGYDEYNEFIVVDVSGKQSKTGRGKAVNITGMTYAADMGLDEVMEVSFTNLYKSRDAIVIKKEDSKTKRALAGATFELIQNGEKLTFDYDEANNVYKWAEAGIITELSGMDDSGFIEVSVTGISFDNGDVTVREKQVPAGYVSAGDIVLSRNQDNEIYILTGHNASYEGGVLIVGNDAESTSVTVKKTWLCDIAEAKPVTVQLLANGRLATAYFSDVDATVILSDDNNYQYTWGGLPASADGSEITWSVRETRIGNEKCKDDYTFANWLVHYANPIYTTNEQGAVTNTMLNISNDTRRILLRVSKMNMSKRLYLSGAEFKLELLDEESGVIDTSFGARYLTTGEDGVATFDNLPYGRYMLTELKAPVGYSSIGESIYLTINENNTVTIDNSYYGEIDTRSDFSIVVKNPDSFPLPETGGCSTTAIYISSIFMMLLSVVSIYILHSRSKGVYRK